MLEGIVENDDFRFLRLPKEQVYGMRSLLIDGKGHIRKFPFHLQRLVADIFCTTTLLYIPETSRAPSVSSADNCYAPPLEHTEQLLHMRSLPCASY